MKTWFRCAYDALPPQTMTRRGGRKREPMSTLRLDALGAAVAMLAKIADPRVRLASIRALRSEVDRYSEPLDGLIVDTVLELRALDSPATWQEIGDLLAVSAQRAHQLAAAALRKRTGAKRCGAMSNPGYRCDHDYGHAGPHEANGQTFTHTNHP